MALLSKGRLANMMLAEIANLPMGTENIKGIAFARLGTIIAFSTKRDIDAAWKELKKKAVKEYPEKFILDDRQVLRWNDGTIVPLDKKITLATYRKLNELALIEDCTVNTLIGRLIKTYKSKR